MLIIKKIVRTNRFIHVMETAITLINVIAIFALVALTAIVVAR